jgi:hypothetical protein
LLSNVRKYVKPKPISRQNKKLTQQHNWRKISSSPRKASVRGVFLWEGKTLCALIATPKARRSKLSRAKKIRKDEHQILYQK